MIDEILQFNKRFVERREYERFITDKYPNKRIAIVTCMDTRLVELLPAALGLKNGDVKIIKNAGATITSPFDSTVRSLLVAIYELGVTEIMIIGHTECGVQGMDSAQMQHLMKERGIPEQHITLMKHCGIDRMVTILDTHGYETVQRPLYEVATSHTARKTFVGNLYRQVPDPNLIASMSGHVEGSRAFKRYRNIDDEMKRKLVEMIN